MFVDADPESPLFLHRHASTIVARILINDTQTFINELLIEDQISTVAIELLEGIVNAMLETLIPAYLIVNDVLGTLLGSP